MSGKFRLSNDNCCAIGLAERELRVHQRLHLRPPAGRTNAQRPQGLVDRRVRSSHRRQDLVAHPVSEERSTLVAWILHPCDASRPRVRLERAPPQLEERTYDRAGRSQRRQPPRPATAQLAHQHRFDLIVARVRCDDAGSARTRGVGEEAMPRLAPHRLESAPRRSPARPLAGHHRESSPARLARHQPCGACRMSAGAVVERCDRRDPPRRDGGECVEQHHRVQPARYGEQQRQIRVARGAARALEDVVPDG